MRRRLHSRAVSTIWRSIGWPRPTASSRRPTCFTTSGACRLRAAARSRPSPPSSSFWPTPRRCRRRPGPTRVPRSRSWTRAWAGSSLPPGLRGGGGAPVGQAVGLTPVERPLRTAPGEHTLAADKSGYRPLALRVAVRAGETTRVRVDPKPIRLTPADEPPTTPSHAAALPAGTETAPTQGPAAATPADAPLYQRWWFWGLIGAAIAGVVTTVAVASSADSLPDSKLGVVRPQF